MLVLEKPKTKEEMLALCAQIEDFWSAQEPKKSVDLFEAKEFDEELHPRDDAGRFTFSDDSDSTLRDLRARIGTLSHDSSPEATEQIRSLWSTIDRIEEQQQTQQSMVTDTKPLEYYAERYSTPIEFVKYAAAEDIASIYAIPGYAARVARQDGDGEGQSFPTILLYTSDGSVLVAHMEREFTSEGDVFHHLFQVEPGFQGEGLAAKINAQAEERYRAMGFNSIRLEADIDVGKYAWARQGYDFLHRSDFQEAKDNIGRVLSEESPKFTTLRSRENNAIEKEVNRLTKGMSHAWELAALDDGNKYAWNTKEKYGNGHLGKAAMLRGGEWAGFKSLDPTSLAQKVSEAYYEAKGVKVKKS